MHTKTLRLRMIRCLAYALVIAATFAALLTPSAGTAQAVTAAPKKAPLCCASAWFPFGWFYTKAECEAKGAATVRTTPVALAYKCYYDSHPPSSTNGRHYHLYVLEAT